MPLCSFSENYLMLGVTPVENLFIQEYLPRASGDYVRVYLYGLMQCYHPEDDMTLERIAHILDLPEETVTNAFQYWERQGLVRRISDQPVSYQYLNLATTLMGESPMDQDVYRHRDFNNRLQQLFGNRLLHPAEFQMACEWVEDLHLPEEVVLIMVEQQVARRGKHFQFKQLGKTALKWAEEGVSTVADAQERVLCETDAWKLAERVLKRFSLRRKPTMDEVDMARKWLEEWKLSPEAVMTACAETINARNPSFGYLDGILKRNSGARSGAQMAEQLEERRRVDDAVKALHEALGMRQVSPSAEEAENYRKYMEAGFEPEAVHRVAVELKGTLREPDMQTLHRALTGFVERGQMTLAQVEEHLEKQRLLREQAAQVLAACGLEKRVSAADVAQLEEWLRLCQMPLILYAAECARGKKLPIPYAGKLLENWRRAGITSVEMARRAHEAGRPAESAPRAAASPTPHALNFQQRTYQEGELDHLFNDLNKYLEDKSDDAQ